MRCPARPQAITKNTAHPFCIRQYATFQDKQHLYFLFDLMPGGDLMDVLVAEAKVIRQRVPTGNWQVACLAPKVRPAVMGRAQPAGTATLLAGGLSSRHTSAGSACLQTHVQGSRVSVCRHMCRASVSV